MEYSQQIQPQAGGLLLAAQVIACGEQVAVMPGSIFPGIVDRQDGPHQAFIAMDLSEQESGAFIGIGGFAVSMDLRQDVVLIS